MIENESPIASRRFTISKVQTRKSEDQNEFRKDIITSSDELIECVEDNISELGERPYPWLVVDRLVYLVLVTILSN